MLQELPVKDKSDAEKLLKITPFRKEVRKTLPHKHNNYFEIIFFTAGAGYHVTDYILNYIHKCSAVRASP